MEIERVTHYVDNVLTQAEARMGLRNTRLLVAWYTNQKNDQSVVHSHPYHELVLPIGGSTVRYSIDGSVYLVHVGELIYFPAQIYHAGIFNIDNDHSDRLVIQIDDALWQACRRNANLKNAAWMHSITVLDPDVCNKWDFQSLFVRMAQSQELPAQMRDIVFEAQVSEMMLLITLATGSGQTTAPSSTNVLVQRAVSYLQAHYQDPTLTTVKLAQELYASREHLSRAFKECTMESIHSYLTHLRMQHCRKALEDGVSVLNACTESGFPDYSSFLKTFRRLYGITPAEYRSQNRKKVWLRNVLREAKVPSWIRKAATYAVWQMQNGAISSLFQRSGNGLVLFIFFGIPAGSCRSAP